MDLAMDFLGPLPDGRYILVVIDYFSRFQLIEFMNRTSTSEVIKFLEEAFSYYGNPASLICDNATYYTSQEFKEFCEENGIELIHSIPYWPQQNGEVERQNSSILKRLKIAHNQGI